MDLIELLVYVAVGMILVFRIAMLAAFVLLPVIVFRTIHHSVVVRRAPAAK